MKRVSLLAHGTHGTSVAGAALLAERGRRVLGLLQSVARLDQLALRASLRKRLGNKRSQSKVEDLQGRLIAVRYNWQLGLHIALAFPVLVRVPIRIEHCEPVQLARNV